MLTLESFIKESWSADGAGECPPTADGLAILHFHCALRVCHPNTRTYVRLLGPCFKTGKLTPFWQHLDCTRDTWTLYKERSTCWPTSLLCSLPATVQFIPRSKTTHSSEAITQGTLPEQNLATFLSLLCLISNPCWPAALYHISSQREHKSITSHTSAKSFPFSNFKCSFTAPSSCFSPFLHSTCSLSVSWKYLALEEIYLPLYAAFPSNATRWKQTVRQTIRPERDYHPLWFTFPGVLSQLFSWYMLL